MAILDSSIVIIAMPAIFRGIGLNPLAPGNIGYLLWMIMGYVLVTAVSGGVAGPARATWWAGCGSTTSASSIFTARLDRPVAGPGHEAQPGPCG